MSILRDAMGTLLQRVPLAGGRMVKELAQSIDRVGGFVERRAARSFFGRLAAGITGRGAREQSRIMRGVVQSQRQMATEIEKLRTHGITLDLDVARVAGYLRDLQGLDADVRELAELTRDVALAVQSCEDQLHEHEAVILEHSAALELHAGRLDDLERRQACTELRQAADESFKRLGERWLDKEIYADVPWACQVFLLAQEVATGACGAYEFFAGVYPGAGHRAALDPVWFRHRLVRLITRHLSPDGPWEGVRPIVDLYVDTTRAMNDVDDRLMVAEILGVGLRAQRPVGPLVASFSRYLEVLSDPTVQLGDREVARRSFGEAIGERWMPRQLTATSFVEAVVAEWGDHAVGGRRTICALESLASAGPDPGADPEPDLVGWQGVP